MLDRFFQASFDEKGILPMSPSNIIPTYIHNDRKGNGVLLSIFFKKNEIGDAKKISNKYYFYPSENKYFFLLLFKN